MGGAGGLSTPSELVAAVEQIKGGDTFPRRSAHGPTALLNPFSKPSVLFSSPGACESYFSSVSL